MGIQTGVYLFHADVGNFSAYLLQKVPGGFTYYVAINGYDAEGNETALSAETQFVRPDAFGPRPHNDDDQSTTAVINHAASQTVPAIDHNRVVWQDERFGPADIFLADLATGAAYTIAEGHSDVHKPKIAGHFVVWAGSSPKKLSGVSLVITLILRNGCSLLT